MKKQTKHQQRIQELRRQDVQISSIAARLNAADGKLDLLNRRIDQWQIRSNEHKYLCRCGTAVISESLPNLIGAILAHADEAHAR